jgi:polyferredoxin
MQLPVLNNTARAEAAPGPFLKPEGRVLATLEEDGRRRWIRPKPSPGRWWKRRFAVAWILIAVYTFVPWIRIDGMPAVLLDLVERKFVIFGSVFRPNETLLFGLAFISVFLGIFLLTAVYGRVWCGWACPQTVYLEFVYRPLERLFLGRGATDAKVRVAAWRRVAMYVAFIVVSAHLANTLLAWFVGADRLTAWIFTSTPFEHPVAFAVFAAVTLLMLFDFAFFREQMCSLVCPYGRFQSALLDKDSLTVAYDRTRGEPRGKGTRRVARTGGCGGSCGCDGNGGCGSGRSCKGGAAAVPDGAAPAAGTAPRGDCIDCTLCVQTCPAGIDIRDGLQLECVQCTQCIDACDAVMDKLGRPRGLIRYSSQREVEGSRRTGPRVRLFVYPALLAVLLTGVLLLVLGREPAFVAVLRTQGVPYTVHGAGTDAEHVESIVRLRIDNRTRIERTYVVEGAEGVELARAGRVAVAPDSSAEVDVVVRSDPDGFVRGRREVALRVRDESAGQGAFDGGVETAVLGPLSIQPTQGGGR